MTDNEKMREAVAAAKKIVASPNGYTETSVLVAKALLEQAAKSVAVVGEPIYWIDPDDDANLSRIGRVGWSPLYGESPAAELATLREKAAMVDELRKDAEIAVTSIYIALDALNEIIEMDGQDNLGDAKREATKAMAQLAAIAQGKGE